MSWHRAVIGVALLAMAARAQQPPAQPKPESPEQAAPAESKSKFVSPEDGEFDVSKFLDEKYGFLPIVVPITEPAVGYGAAGGLAFINQPFGKAKEGFGRPNVTFVGGLATENGTRGLMAGDLRHWYGDRVQTLVGVVDASVNLDFFGVGSSSTLDGHHISYNLQPTGGMARAKVRVGETKNWLGLGYAYANTEVDFDAPAGAPGLPSFHDETNIGGLTPSYTFDSRDNIFTPTRGTYFDASVGVFSQALGGDDEFQRAQLMALEYLPLDPKVDLGLRAELQASFGDEPFYMRPYIALRGAPAMRYQGEEMALIESEVRWQFHNRWSAVGFAGTGSAWNESDQFDDKQSVVTGGTGLRYEIARDYGIHVGIDVAFGPDGPVLYVQFGSAWSRP